jgi:hypothetical protein
MPFHIALNMAGAVSAGAYTAGVVDFLVEALDEWYAAKEQQRQLHGEDRSLWTIPGHDVVLEVLSGASAGGMCSAISSVALKEQFDHIRTANPAPGTPRNRLYQSWVDTIDIMKLLGTEDLPGGRGPVKSLLDSAPLADIAKVALTPDPARQIERKWVSPNLKIILTLSNLRGIPYSLDEANGESFEERMNYHADRIQFTVAASGAQDDDCTYALNYSDSGNSNWQLLATAAMATGAFPVMLASRVLERKKADYEGRRWTVNHDKPNEQGLCQERKPAPPAWSDVAVPSMFPNAYADGGVTNNNPFELARLALVEAAHNTGHNPREAEKANAAVIVVAPFPGDDKFDLNYDSDKATEIGNVISSLIGALINQSRFQGEEVALTQSERVFSRFAIAPSDDTDKNQPALLCGALSAFGGFVDHAFRDHDYQLGRRNCQKFLKDVFVLPEENVTLQPLLDKTPEATEAMRRNFGKKLEDGRYWYQVIPFMPGVATEVPALNRAGFFTTEGRLKAVAAQAETRLKTVLDAFLNTPGSNHGGWTFLLNLILRLEGGKIEGAILDQLKAGLKSQIGDSL